jgi:hypothetical protein
MAERRRFVGPLQYYAFVLFCQAALLLVVWFSGRLTRGLFAIWLVVMAAAVVVSLILRWALSRIFPAKTLGE